MWTECNAETVTPQKFSTDNSPEISELFYNHVQHREHWNYDDTVFCQWLLDQIQMKFRWQHKSPNVLALHNNDNNEFLMLVPVILLTNQPLLILLQPHSTEITQYHFRPYLHTETERGVAIFDSYLQLLLIGHSNLVLQQTSVDSITLGLTTPPISHYPCLGNLGLSQIDFNNSIGQAWSLAQLNPHTIVPCILDDLVTVRYLLRLSCASEFAVLVSRGSFKEKEPPVLIAIITLHQAWKMARRIQIVDRPWLIPSSTSSTSQSTSLPALWLTLPPKMQRIENNIIHQLFQPIGVIQRITPKSTSLFQCLILEFSRFDNQTLLQELQPNQPSLPHHRVILPDGGGFAKYRRYVPPSESRPFSTLLHSHSHSNMQGGYRPWS